MRTCLFLWAVLVFHSAQSQHIAKMTELQMEKQSITQLQQFFEEQVPTDMLRIRGYATDAMWKHLFDLLKKSHVRHLYFEENNFESVSEDLIKCKALYGLSIRGNHEIVLDETIGVINQMAQLKSLEMEITHMEDIPAGIFQCWQLERLVLHEHLSSDESAAAECIAVEVPLNKADQFYKNLKAYVYLSKASWNAYQDQNDLAGLKRLKPCVLAGQRYDHVLAPIESADVQVEVIQVSATVEANYPIENSSNVLRVPANAFVDAYGTPVKDEIDLEFREFKNPSDFIRSGIPMSVEANDEVKVFESAGMVDISAKSKGEEVFLADGKTIQVLMTSKSPKVAFDTWAFDDATGTWQDTGESLPIDQAAIDSFAVVSKAVFAYLASPFRKFALPDTTSCAARFKSGYYYNSLQRRSKDPIVRFQDLTWWQKLKDNSKYPTLRVKNVRSGANGEVYFNLVGSRFLHPEMTKLNGITWRSDLNMTEKEFEKSFARNRHYGDMRLEGSEGAYVLVLKEGRRLEHLPVTPMKEQSMDKEKAYETASFDYDTYSKSFDKRSKRFDKQNMRKFKLVDRRRKRQFEKIRRRVDPLKNEAETAMDMDTFDAYARNQWTVYQKSLAANDAAKNEVSRILSVNQLGLCNIDRLKSLPDQQVVGVEVLVDNQPIVLTHVYVTIKNMNTVVANPVDRQRRYQRVTFFGDNMTALVFITHDNKVGIVDASILQEAYDSHQGLLSIPGRLIPEGMSLEDIQL
jgi:hypothetical protein